MTGRITHIPPVKSHHERYGCGDMPSPEAHTPGTIWTCDDCDKKWVVVQGAQYNEVYSAWRILTKRNMSGDDL